MEDKELKKQLDKIPDVDEHGEPIYKIDDAAKEPVFRRAKPDVAHGSAQDEKDESAE
jgi:hypothetical protein